MSDLLATLWQSTADLKSRFDLLQNTDDAFKCFWEEVWEFSDAALSGEKHEAAEEAADVLVTALGVLASRGVTLADFVAAVDSVIIKNDKKSHETHRVYNGKVTRKERIPHD